MQLSYFKKSWWTNIWAYLDGLALKHADRVIAIGEKMQEVLQAKLGDSHHDKVVVIPNMETVSSNPH